MANKFKTVLLLGLLTGIILFIGSFWGRQGLTVALIFSIAMNFISYFFSDKIALRMYRAQPVTRDEAPQLYRIMDFLCSRSDIPMPKLYIIPDDSPSSAHMFIMHPFSGRALMNLFSTHPPTHKRIERLLGHPANF